MNAKYHTYNNKVSVHNYVAMYLQQLATYAQKVAT